MRTASVTLAVLPLFLGLAAGCAHAPQPASLTSAQAPAAPAPPVAPPAPKVAEPAAPVAQATPEAAAPQEEVNPAKSKKKADEPLTFEQLSAQLGADDKLAIASVGDGTSEVPASKGLSADNYSTGGVAHQAAPETAQRGGDVKVSGGITVAQVRDGVRAGNDRLRICYERGLANAPHLAGHVDVTFSIDERGAVTQADTASETLPTDVTACVKTVFESLTFAAPKAPPAKVVYPIAFRKE